HGSQRRARRRSRGAQVRRAGAPAADPDGAPVRAQARGARAARAARGAAHRDRDARPLVPLAHHGSPVAPRVSPARHGRSRSAAARGGGRAGDRCDAHLGCRRPAARRVRGRRRPGDAHPPARGRARRRARRLAAACHSRPVGRALGFRERSRARSRSRGTLAQPRRLPAPSWLRRSGRRDSRQSPVACPGKRPSPCPGDAVPRRVVEPLETGRRRFERSPAAASPAARVAGAPAQGETEGTTTGPAGGARDVAGRRQLRAPAVERAIGPGRPGGGRRGTRPNHGPGAVGPRPTRRPRSHVRPAQLRRSPGARRGAGGASPRLPVAASGCLRLRARPDRACVGGPGARPRAVAPPACRAPARRAAGRSAHGARGARAGRARGPPGGPPARRVAASRPPAALLSAPDSDWSEVRTSRTLGAMRLSPAQPLQPVLLSQITGLALIPANAAGAAAVYLYFSYVDPWGGRPQPNAETAFLLFTAITTVLLVATTRLGNRWMRPVHHWSHRLRAGEPPSEVPVAIRRRVLNAALMIGLLSLGAWFAAGLFYLVVLGAWYRIGAVETLRVFLTIVLVGGPVASALAFLVSEYHWRREIPLFFPDGDLEHTGVLRLPIRVRLLVTFLLTSIL